MTGISQEQDRLTSDMLHNRNCYAYLKVLKPFINEAVIEVLPDLLVLTSLYEYSPNRAYGDLYTSVLTYIEEQIDSIYLTLKPTVQEAVNNLLYAIYHNDNRMLEQGDWLRKIHCSIRPIHSHKDSTLERYLDTKQPRINKHSPQISGSLFSRAVSLFTPNFKPQLDTNIPSIRRRNYTHPLEATEYRFGTQAQRHQGAERVCPLFKHWLAINAKKTNSTKPIAHVYFNNLGLDRGKFDIPGSAEKELSLVLHQLEDDPTNKIAVITLPAYYSLMGLRHYRQTLPKLTYKKVFKEFLGVLLNEKHESGIADFKISPAVRKLLFEDEGQEVKIFTRLLKRSFKAMGIASGSRLSKAQKQAVWLHFNKFELTDFILTKLQPLSYNFSCKDAIDRGAVASVYYNLLKSISLNHPMSREEFEQALDLPAITVKGRGMNRQRKILWNALDTLINAHHDQFALNPKCFWLIYWRDMNCPVSRANELLQIRVKQLEALLNLLPATKIHVKHHVETLIKDIREQHKYSLDSEQLLLEVISRTTELLHEKPSKEAIIAYKKLATELQIKHPFLKMIAAGMLIFLGALFFNEDLINKGIAKFKQGFFARKNEELSKHIEQYIEVSTPPSSPS
jgi:hypothetical protein